MREKNRIESYFLNSLSDVFYKNRVKLTKKDSFFKNSNLVEITGQIGNGYIGKSYVVDPR